MDLATIDHLLTTTRSVRKRLDLSRPVEPDIIQDCLEIAIQAPTGSNRQGYHFMVITDTDKRAELADLYHKAFRSTGAWCRVGLDNGASQVRPGSCRLAWDS